MCPGLKLACFQPPSQISWLDYNSHLLSMRWPWGGKLWDKTEKRDMVKDSGCQWSRGLNKSALTLHERKKCIFSEPQLLGIFIMYSNWNVCSIKPGISACYAQWYIPRTWHRHSGNIVIEWMQHYTSLNSCFIFCSTIKVNWKNSEDFFLYAKKRLM